MSLALARPNGSQFIIQSITQKVVLLFLSSMFCLDFRALTDFLFKLAGEAYILVNGEAATNISDLNSRAGYHKSVPVELILTEGDSNTITFGAVGSSGMFCFP
jgi:hypothetical protein